VSLFLFGKGKEKMKVNIERFAIEKALHELSGILKNQSVSLPILERILIEASGQTVTLTATDLCTASRISIEADVLVEGSTLPPGKKFINIIDVLKDYKTISIETVKNKVVIASEGKASFKLPDASSDDYPDVKLPDSISFTEVKSDDLLSIIDGVTYVVTKKSYNPAFEAICLEGLKSEMRCVATDGQRLAITRSAMEGDLDISDKGIIIPATAAKEIARLLKHHRDCETVDIGFSHDTMVVRNISSSGTTVLTIKLVDVIFPNYKKIIPRDSCISFTADKEALIGSLRRARIVVKDDPNHPVLLIGEGDKLALQSKNQNGFMSDEIALDSDTTEPFCFSINANYLLDAVNTISAEDVCVSYKPERLVAVNGDGGSLNIVTVLRN